MLADSQTFPRCTAVLPGPAPVQDIAFPPGCLRVDKLASRHFCSLQGMFMLHGRAIGQGQAFLVAQAAWGADAGPAAGAAYGEISRLLQEQGLTMVQERLFGSLAVQEAVLAARDAALRAENLSPDTPFTYVQGQPPWGEGLARGHYPGSGWR